MSIEVIVIIVLCGLLGASAVERFFYQKYMTNELSRCMTKIMSKNITEYAQAVRDEKQPDKEVFAEPEETLITEASDEEFAKHIEQVNQ